MTLNRLIHDSRRLHSDRRGVALIEFAFATPVLVLLFVGGYQLMDAVSAYRKVTTTVRALSDITTQNTSVTPNGVQQIIAASQQIMAPYPTSQAVVRITQVKIDQTGNATVDWSQGMNGSGYTKGSAVTLPSGLAVANTYLIYSEINYQYVPGVASGIIGQIPLRDTIFMSPRNSASVPCADCS